MVFPLRADTAKATKERNKVLTVDDCEHDITDAKFTNILNQLDQTYLNNYSDWLCVTRTHETVFHILMVL